MKKSIIDFIKRNRVSTTELADCMEKSGAINNVNAINRNHYAVGNIFYVCTCNGTNWDVHKEIENVEDGDIIFIDVLDSLEKAVFGDLVSKYLLLYRQCNAIVTNGFLRDAPKLIKEKWPIWCSGFSPIGFSNEEIQKSDKQLQEIKERKNFYQNAIIVCDDTGVIVIPEKFHTKKFLEKIHFIEEQEDIWLDCIDRKNYSTFETVCLQKYLRD